MTSPFDPAVGLAGEKQIRQGKGRALTGRATWTVSICLGIVCLLWTIPVIGLFINSFRTRDAQLNTGWWTAIANPLDFTAWTLNNYYVALFATSEDGVNMGQAFVNSLIVSVPASVVPILVAAFAAYAFTFMQWHGRDVVFLVFVALLVVPNQVALVPLLKLYAAVGLNGTFLAVWLVHIGSGCRSRSSFFAATCRVCPCRSSNRQESTGQATSRPSGGSSSRFRCRRSRPSRSCSSSGCGTTSWWRCCSSAGGRTRLRRSPGRVCTARTSTAGSSSPPLRS